MRAHCFAGRSGQKINVDHHVHFLGRARKSPLEVRRPRATERPPVRLASTGFVAAYSQERLSKAPKDLRIAIIHEDGAYGVDVSKGVEQGASKAGFNI